MNRLANGWKIPSTVSEKIELLSSYQKTLEQMETENPISIFKEHMENGLLHKAALQDAMNQLTTYANLFQSAKELTELIAKSNDSSAVH